MLVGVGADLCEVDRMALAVSRTGRRLLERVFTPGERERAAGASSRLARAFAAKEATFKVLGRGWPHGVGYDEVELVEGVARPSVRLTGRAADRALELGIARLHVGVSDDGRLAAAFVLAESA